MDNSVESNVALVSFKIEPNIIPATDIRRSGKFSAAVGGHGDIWKCDMSTQSGTRPVAVKIITIPDSRDVTYVTKTARRIRREAYVWIQLLHDNILPLEGVTEEFGVLPALVSLWMENGELEGYLKREVGLSWERKLSMVRDVAAGLQYLHDKDIVHGNLTALDVLVSGDGRLCLAGYGLSVILAESGNATFNSCHPGHVRWMPPEALGVGGEEEDEDEPATKAWDIYSFGCIIMLVFTGNQPYAWLANVLSVMGAIQKGRKPFFKLDGVGEEIQQLAQLCWSSDRKHRPSVGEIVEFLWSQTNIVQTMKTMLSQLPVTVTQISQAVLMKCDYHPDGLDVLGAALKCKWVVHGSSEIEVAVKTSRDDVNSQNDINKIFNRISS
ncbi:kinase-like domain-containing protein [Suillus occidentalis]|nr:kinase-like domain-containing protein [Suillus occidentalis]